MTTLLDIIDTAVKIGLGAAIAGVTSYYLAKHNQENERNKTAIQDKKNLSKELALKLELAKSKIDESAYHLHAGDKPGARKMTADAADELRSAAAIANLLGRDELVSIVEKMCDQTDIFYKEIGMENVDEDSLFDLDLEFNNLKKSAYPFIRSTYNDAA